MVKGRKTQVRSSKDPPGESERSGDMPATTRHVAGQLRLRGDAENPAMGGHEAPRSTDEVDVASAGRVGQTPNPCPTPEDSRTLPYREYSFFSSLSETVSMPFRVRRLTAGHSFWKPPVAESISAAMLSISRPSFKTSA